MVISVSFEASAPDRDSVTDDRFWMQRIFVPLRGVVNRKLRKQGYTFPVLLAHDLVEDVLSDVGIPQVWIVDTKGKWLWDQVGFDLDIGKWKETVLEKVGAKRMSD
jgi:hypothetical protein